jgi:hypothetical protein
MMGYERKKAQNAPLCDIELLMKSIENFIFCSSHGATSASSTMYNAFLHSTPGCDDDDVSPAEKRFVPDFFFIREIKNLRKPCRLTAFII